MEPKNESPYVNLMVVVAGGKKFVVEAPGYKRCAGSVIDFNGMRGKCTNVMFIEKGGDKYMFVAALYPIYQAEKIYSLSWEAESNGET